MSVTRRQFSRSLILSPALGVLAIPPRASAQADDGDGEAPANVFISPAGQPFRARDGAPYPVAAWFKQADKNADGKLDKPEFLADAEAFFKLLDRNGDGALSPLEVAIYEQRVAPEVLGYRVDLGAWRGGAVSRRGLLWRAQIHQPSPIDPGGAPDEVGPHTSHHLDESGAGASPFSFFDEPEPVTAADTGFRGIVFKTDFLKLAEVHFATLDRTKAGYLTLVNLPKTPVQRRLEKMRRR